MSDTDKYAALRKYAEHAVKHEHYREQRQLGRDTLSLLAALDAANARIKELENMVAGHKERIVHEMERVRRLQAERHACPGCNHLATRLVNADACPLQDADYPGCDRYFCADEDTAACAERIVTREEER